LFAMLTQGLGWVQRPLIDRLPNDLSKSIPILIMYGSNVSREKAEKRKIID